MNIRKSKTISGRQMRAIGAVIVGGLAILLMLVMAGLFQESGQQSSGYGYQPVTTSVTAIDGRTRLPLNSYQPTCENPRTRDDADLCAQWAAVEQVAESNRLASTNLRITLLALFLTGVGTVLLVWTLDETRETARKELRAYISVQPKGVYARDGRGYMVVPIYIKNDGQTPANGLCVQSWFQLEEEPHKLDPRTVSRANDEGVRTDSAIMIPPHDGMTVYVTCPFNPTLPAHGMIDSGELAIVHVGDVSYTDAFGYRQCTSFAHYHRGELLDDANSMRCPFGNEAT